MTTPTSLSDLEAAFPEFCAQLVERGRVAGIAAERQRVLQHLRLGEHCVSFRLAHESIASGAELDEQLAERYLTQRMQRLQVDARQQDSDGAGAALDGFTTTTRRSHDGRAAVADEVERLMSQHTGDPTPQPRNLIR